MISLKGTKIAVGWKDPYTDGILCPVNSFPPNKTFAPGISKTFLM